MGYKEKVQDEIEKDGLKNLWEEICKSYEQGGTESIKSVLNSLIEKFKKDFDKELGELVKKL